MTDSLYYALKDGQVVPVDKMTEEMWDISNRRVALTYFTWAGEPVEDTGNIEARSKATWQVSTVFLVINHAFNGEDAPILFETMVFHRQGSWKRRDSWSDVHCERYTTIEAARAGHERIAAALQTALRLGWTPKREDFDK